MPRRKWRLWEADDRVEVPTADEMDDETFLKHLEKRHADECKIEGRMHRHALDAWLPTYRAFHDRLHTLGPASHYDHEHEED